MHSVEYGVSSVSLVSVCRHSVPGVCFGSSLTDIILLVPHQGDDVWPAREAGSGDVMGCLIVTPAVLVYASDDDDDDAGVPVVLIDSRNGNGNGVCRCSLTRAPIL